MTTTPQNPTGGDQGAEEGAEDESPDSPTDSPTGAEVGMTDDPSTFEPEEDAGDDPNA